MKLVISLSREQELWSFKRYSCNIILILSSRIFHLQWRIWSNFFASFITWYCVHNGVYVNMVIFSQVCCEQNLKIKHTLILVWQPAVRMPWMVKCRDIILCSTSCISRMVWRSQRSINCPAVWGGGGGWRVDVCTEGLWILDIHIPFLLKFHSDFVFFFLCVRKKKKNREKLLLDLSRMYIYLFVWSNSVRRGRSLGNGRLLLKCMEKIQFKIWQK